LGNALSAEDVKKIMAGGAFLAPEVLFVHVKRALTFNILL
jgi:hypothetical protein